jgi:hypothetical protein
MRLRFLFVSFLGLAWVGNAATFTVTTGNGQPDPFDLQNAIESLGTPMPLSKSCVRGIPVDHVAAGAPTGELLTSPVRDGKGQPSPELNQYGVGVDCHSGFFQICILILYGREHRKLERKVPALWDELIAALDKIKGACSA